MKIRKGFVSNSSSCSFLVLLDEEPNTKVDMKEYCDYCGSLDPQYEELRKSLKKISDNFDKIPEDLLPAVKKVMEYSTRNVDGMYFFENEKEFDDSDYMSTEEVCDEFQKEYEAGIGKVMEMEQDTEFSNDYYPKGYIPVEQFMKFPTWQEDLTNPNGYFHQAVKENITRELENFEYSKDLNINTYHDRPFELWAYEKTDEYRILVEKIIDKLTDQYIENILKEYGDCEGYFVEYITDGDSKNPFRYIAETQQPFHNFPFFIKYNKH